MTHTNTRYYIDTIIGTQCTCTAERHTFRNAVITVQRLSLLYGKPQHSNILIIMLSSTRKASTSKRRRRHYIRHDIIVEASWTTYMRTIHYAVTTCSSKIKHHPVNSAIQLFFLFDDRLIQIHVQYQNNHSARLARCQSPKIRTVFSCAVNWKRDRLLYIAPNRNTNNAHMGDTAVNKTRRMTVELGLKTIH